MVSNCVWHSEVPVSKYPVCDPIFCLASPNVSSSNCLYIKKGHCRFLSHSLQCILHLLIINSTQKIRAIDSVNKYLYCILSSITNCTLSNYYSFSYIIYATPKVCYSNLIITFCNSQITTRHKFRTMCRTGLVYKCEYSDNYYVFLILSNVYYINIPYYISCS